MLTRMPDWHPLPTLLGVGPPGEPDAGPRSPEPQRRRWPSPRWVAVGAVAVIAVAALVISVRSWSRPSLTRRDVAGIASATVGKSITSLASQPPPGVTVYGQVAPAMVIMQSQGGTAGSEALGAGVIVNTRGDILTALHVVKGAASIEVSFSDGSDAPATLSSSDPNHDIAVLT